MRVFTAVVVLIASISLVSLRALEEPQPSYQDLKREAERQFENGSYALAHSVYMRIDKKQLSSAEARWVDFRLADTLWRSEAATQSADTTKLDQATQQLELLVRDIQRVDDRDRVWAEVQESLGDFWWARRDSRNWNQAWTHYQLALDWWAGSSDLELARARYLKIVWTMSKPPEVEPYYYYGYYGNNLPLEILENTLKISKTENDQAHAHYLMAMTLRNQGGEWEQRQRVPEEFEAALKVGKSTEWYDDALFNYAEWMANQGRAVPLEDGQWRQEPDYVKALELYRRLVSEFRKGESRHYDQAQQQIKNIIEPTLQVSVPNVFLPGSEIQYQLNWRNIQKIEMAVYRVDLVRDFRISERDFGPNWIQRIDLSQANPLKRWPKVAETRWDYTPGQEALRLEEKLPRGAYILEAATDGRKSRDILLVTDASLVLKSAHSQILAYFCDVLTGAPIANATVKLWHWRENYTAEKNLIQTFTAKTDKDGLAIFQSLPAIPTVFFAAAVLNDRQAFAQGYQYGYDSDDQLWKIYAFTDRPAYRPKETVQWKFVARRTNGQIYSTPASQTIEYEIADPRGTKVKEDKVTLNAFGSAWGSLELNENQPLGQYLMTFWDAGRHRQVGRATLFRLEEYKLPEFKVSVKTPEEDGKRKTFRLGEKVEVNVQADYYFGGPVSNASVEVVVYQNPFFQGWFPWREYPWFYADMDVRPPQYYGGDGQVIKRETLKTDSTGKVTLTFETPRNAQQDFEYRIEARVTDVSRREIVASERVRVTRQRYYVYPRAEHNLYRPQDKVTINIKAVDANDQPVQVEGRVKLTRDYWFEFWLDPDGKEVKGDELRRLQEKSQIFPPLPTTGRRPWQLKFRGYQQDEILTRPMKTDTSGEAQFAFTPEREGYYRMAWTSQDRGQAPIRAEATVWVARNATTELGYRHGGLEIILDKDTFHAGKTAAVMISVPTPDRYVLFSVEGEGLYDYQLVHVTGTVKLLELPIEEKHEPNIFLNAVMVSDRQIFEDTKQVVVPPIQHFLKMEVKADRSEYQPQEEGTLNITTTDADGKPVSAEVALAVADESVFYIQQDYAGDPRQFFFGRKRSLQVSTGSTFNVKSYVKLVEGPQDQLVDERVLLDMERDESAGGMGNGRGGGIGGGVYRVPGGVAGSVPGGQIGGVVGGVVGPPAASVSMVAKSARMMRSDMKVAREMSTDQLRANAPSEAEEPAVQVRTDFRATVFWQPDLITDQEGKATVRFKYPDSLTSWKATARAVSAANQFGIASTSTRTRKPLIVRLQAPRFFVVGDTVTISGVINNNTDKPLIITPSLEATGLTLPRTRTIAPIEVKGNGEARVDWTVSVQAPGTARLKVMARGTKYADAMEKEFPAFEHGIEKFISRSGKLRGSEALIKVELPAQRKIESTFMNVMVTPSLAVTMLDALPYLIDYPYGCTEQTMSRFLPATVVAKTLKDLGLQSEQVMGHIFGGIEPETAKQTHPKGKKDLNDLDKMIKQGLDRLYDFQHSDGGWGWWKEGDSDHFMTAYVVWGLTQAREAGVSLKSGVLEHAVDDLDKELVEEENHPDLQAWMLHALATYHADSKLGTVGPNQSRAYKNLWANRDQLNAYTRALLALSAHSYGDHNSAKILIENLQNGVKIDSKPDVSVILREQQSSQTEVMGTAHWGEDGIYWQWSEGGVEATAFALRALLAIDPQNKLVEPVMNWLIKNRRGAQWNNTRDTAIVVLAMNDYLRKSGELSQEAEYEISVNGSRVEGRKVTPRDVLSAPSQWAIDRQILKSGSNEIRILRKSGNGPLYFSVQARFFSLGEPLTAAGSELYVGRQYYRLTNRPTLLKGFVSERVPFKDGGTLQSGDRVEVSVTIEAKNNYEYLVFEDLKPAGLEAVQVRSGEPLYARELKAGAVDQKNFKEPSLSPKTDESDYTGRSRWVYQELRDRKVALFIDKLPQGIWEIHYELRAEIPGKYHALPVLGYAMYVPEIRANGEETRITVTDGGRQ